MRIPDPSPDPLELVRTLPPERLRQLFGASPATLRGRYLHWDEIRFRSAPEGLTREEWWTAIAMARAPLFQELPLLDKHGRRFRFATPAQALIDLHRIDRDAAGRLKSAVDAPIREYPDRFLISALIEEAITSSQLEGATTTRSIAADMLRTGRKPRDRSEAMIFNNYRAMEHLRTIKTEPLTPARILELHRILTAGTLENPADAGRLRTDNEARVIDGHDHTELHAPPNFTELPARLERLCAFANADESSLPFVHPVLRAILLHFMIGYDHPFADGNGPTARALFYWSMARAGYWLMEYTSISRILRHAPTRYMRSYLFTETDNNDATYFLLHQLITIRRAIAALHEYLERKTHEQKDTEQLLAASPNLRTHFNHRQLALLTHALRNTGEAYRMDTHQRSHNVVYQTARNDLIQLHQRGLLERGKQGNAYVFFAPPDLRQRLTDLAK